jgi:hypothetical protein
METVAKERDEYQNTPVKKPSLFVDSERRSWNFNDDVRWFDHCVFHPRTAYSHGYPDCVFAYG